MLGASRASQGDLSPWSVDWKEVYKSPGSCLEKTSGAGAVAERCSRPVPTSPCCQRQMLGIP
ncbi:hypothetical protein U0070_012628 [Myodes glareolus]|uniref:Uncharacterized protein n=1 Tax=Myodes glareolus TaxID=447135 RepID=A0AAW0JQ72_MYOGA